MPRLQQAPERASRIQAIIAALQAGVKLNSDAAAIASARLRQGVDPSTISDEVNSLLADAEAIVVGCKDLIDEINFEYREELQLGCPGAFTQAQIDYDNSGTFGHIIAANSQPVFNIFSAGDKVQIVGALNDANKLVRTVASVGGTPTGSTITFTANLGADEATETKLRIILLER